MVDRVTRYSQFIPVKVKKILRKSQPHFCDDLRKLRLKQKNAFLIKMKYIYVPYQFVLNSIKSEDTALHM